MKALGTIAFGVLALFAANFASASPAKADNVGVYAGSNGFAIEVGHRDRYYGDHRGGCWSKWDRRHNRHCWRGYRDRHYGYGYRNRDYGYRYNNQYRHNRYYRDRDHRRHWRHNRRHRDRDYDRHDRRYRY